MMGTENFNSNLKVNAIRSIAFLMIFFLTGSSNFKRSKNQDIPNNTRALIGTWKDRYSDKALKAFTFVQETIKFEGGQPTDTSTWYEVIQYPDLFRIDFGGRDSGNSNLSRNDSIYVLRKGEMVHTGKEVQEFLIEGGLYYLDVETTLEKLRAKDIDPNKFYRKTYQGRETIVIGAKDQSDLSPQIWLDEERRYAVWRLSKMRDGRLLEVRYSDFKRKKGHWIETKIDFLVDGELIQTERYQNIKINPELNPDIFDPKKFTNRFWY